MEPVTLGLADDETLFLNGLVAIFAQDPRFQIAFAVESGEAVLKQLEGAPEPPKILVLDLRMKGMDGVETIGRVREQYPEQKVVVLSSHYREAFIGYMLKLKVNAFLPKNSVPEELMDILEKVHQKGLFFTPGQLQSLQEELSSGKKPQSPVAEKEDELTPREIEVLKLICDQRTNAEIAEKLFISIRTVEGHRNHLFLKTGARNMVGLVLFALFHGFLNPQEKLLEYGIASQME